MTTRGGRAAEGTPLYVHFPFCAAKCHYCDFFSVEAGGHDLDATLDAILTEATARAPRHPETVFIGGGTPSLLDTRQLTGFFDSLNGITAFRESADEVSFECNPESLDHDKAAALLDLGINRLSIGFQSLEPEMLQLFGRIHDTDQAFRAYEAARKAGVGQINVDLIYAAPGHRPQLWREALSRVLALEPEHLSAYNLAFEEETTFSRWLEVGVLSPLSDDLELELFSITRELCDSAGLPAYEISNYARPGRECRHNLGYWGNGSYVGVGPSAVSHLDRRRSGNVKSIPEYLSRIRAGGHAGAWTELLAPPAKLGETWWLGLRAERGVDPAEARRVAAWEGAEDPALATAERLEQLGLLECRADRYRLSSTGLPLADAVSAEFLVEDVPDAASGPSSGQGTG